MGVLESEGADCVYMYTSVGLRVVGYELRVYRCTNVGLRIGGVRVESLRVYSCGIASCGVRVESLQVYVRIGGKGFWEGKIVVYGGRDEG